MGVFLRLGNSELSHVLAREIFTHCHFKLFGRECNRYIRHCLVILGHADKFNGEEAVSSLKAVKLFINECACDLTCSVGAEVKEHNAVAALDHAVFVNNGGYDKFICYTVCI